MGSATALQRGHPVRRLLELLARPVLGDHGGSELPLQDSHGPGAEHTDRRHGDDQQCHLAHLSAQRPHPPTVGVQRHDLLESNYSAQASSQRRISAYA